MKTKILWQTTQPSLAQTIKDFNMHDTELEDPSDAMLETIKQVAREDTEIVWNTVPRGTYKLTEPYLELLNNVGVIEQIINAEAQGFDAVVIGCGNDPALKEARQAVEIPVLVPGESAMLMACLLGSKFGIVGVDHTQVALMEEKVRQYGLTDRAILPPRNMVFDGNLNDELGAIICNPETVNPMFEEAALACIADGADAIITGCTGISSALSQIGYREVADTGVPVIDTNHAALKMAEMMADMRRTVGLGKSQRGPFKSTPTDERDLMKKLAGF